MNDTILDSVPAYFARAHTCYDSSVAVRCETMHGVMLNSAEGFAL